MACAISSLLFFCLLLVAPRLGRSFLTSYTDDGNHVIYRSPGGASPPTLCLDLPSEDDDDDDDDNDITLLLPVFHRLSPCSRHAGAQSQGNTSAADVLRRDTEGLRSLGAMGIKVTASPNGSIVPFVTFPGSSDYHVELGYGTPPQRLAVGFDIMSTGISLLVCKPCAATGAPCDRTFDPSRSSSLEGIPFPSPDCLFESCSGPSCMTTVSMNGTAYLNMTVVTDNLAVGWSTVDEFRFACLETGSETVDETVSGILDVSQSIHSLPSRAPASPNTVAFSYCLPSATTSQGFLSFVAIRPELYDNSSVRYTALRHKPGQPNMYFVQLTGITVGGKSIPVPPAGFAGDTIVALRTTFTYLRRDIYAVLREEFEGQTKRYNHSRVPPVGGLDTCYDFAGVDVIILPSIKLEFEGGAVMELGIEQMMYLQQPHGAFSVACLAFAPSPYRQSAGTSEAPPVAVIGTLAQTNTEVAYDLLGGMVGFAPNAC